MDNCHNWEGSNNGKYGYFYVDGKLTYAHRYAWKSHNGPIPDGLFVCHKCDNTLCINPEHLFLGSNASNMYDSAKKGRQAKSLTWNKVNAIRYIRSSTGMSQRKIARMFGVSQFCIGQVIRNETWRDNES